MIEDRSQQSLVRPHELLDFMIEKTHGTYYETGRAVQRAFLTYLILVSLEVVLVLPMGAENVVLPMMQVSLKRPYGALAILVLSYGALYWFYAMRVMSHQLGRKLKELLYERYAIPIETIWFLGHPLPHWGMTALIKPSRFTGSTSVPRSVTYLSEVFTTLFSLAIVILPFVFVLLIARSLNWSILVRGFAFALTVLLLVPIFIAVNAANLSAENVKLYQG